MNINEDEVIPSTPGQEDIDYSTQSQNSSSILQALSEHSEKLGELL